MGNKSKRKKIFLWSITAIFAFVLLLMGLFFCIFVSFDPGIKAAELSDRDYWTGARLTQQVLYRALRSKNEYDVRELKISNAEMQSVMRITENADTLLYLITGAVPREVDGKNTTYKLHYDKGIFSFKIRLTDVVCRMCFVGQGQFKVNIENGKPDINFISLKIGRFELPDKYKEMIKNQIYDYLKEDSGYDIVRASVIKTDFDKNGNVRIYYLPYRLRKHIKNIVK